MPLESASFISQLVATNPASGDLKSEGDDHIRVIKAAVQGSFPSLGATAVTRTATQLNNAADKTGDTYTGAHDFSGATGGLTLASRVRAEYSNATPSSRSLFQSSVTNGQTLIGAMPNGTSAVSGSRYYNASTPDNSGFVGYRVDLTEARIESSKNGTGSFLPLNFYTSDTLRMSIATSGNITFSSPVSIPSGSTITGFAPLASPALTGTPTAPTASAGTSNTQIATTAFVATALSGGTVSSGSGQIRENFTATAGQTVFTLTNSYVVGGSRLNVFINGVRQHPSAYVETNSTTVTFTDPLNLGDVVLFETILVTLGSSMPASSVFYNATADIPTGTVQDVLTNMLPSMTGNSGRFLTTNGTTKSWALPIPDQTSNSGRFLTTNGATASWASLPPQSMVRSARASNTILGTADSTTLIDYTSGTFTQTITAAATLTNGWYCWLRNSGTGVITVDPNGSETIGGAATAALNPGDIWVISSDGTNIQLQRLYGLNRQIYTSGSGNFTVPAGVNRIYVECWGGGAGTTVATQSGGGGGYSAAWLNTTPASNIAYAVGAGGTSSGTNGGNTTFGALAANGGQGPGGNPGLGGTATGGDINIQGGTGMPIGSGSMGGGSFGTPVPGTTNGSNGNAGQAYFPGGGACGVAGGAAGASGQIIIRWV